MYYKRCTGSILVHKSTNFPDWIQWTHHSEGKTHCEECLMLDGCWFAGDAHPPCPHHPGCHCTLEPIDHALVFANAAAHSDYGKFDPYLFNTTGTYPHSREKLFKEWGYTVDDAAWLQAEIERQAREKYISGEYVLGKLNKDGQRISIRVTIPRKDNGNAVSFITGWMAYPNGKIQLTTPYGGNNMKMMDCVEVITEKDTYAKEGVHMGMQGWICMEQYRDGYWLVNFPQLGENPDIATLGIKEEDLKVVPIMNAALNEEIKARFDAPKETDKSFADGNGLSNYVI